MPFFCFASLAIVIVSFLPLLPSINSIALIALGGLVLLFYLRSLWLAGLVSGFVFACAYGHYLIAQQLPQTLDGEDFLLSGHVVGLPESNASKTRVDIRVQDISLVDNGQENLPWLTGKKIRLNLYHKLLSSDSQADHYSKLAPGDHINFKVKLRRPRGFVNPASFDYQLYLLRQKLVATGYVKPDKANTLAQGLGKAGVDQLRFRIRQTVSNFTDSEAAGALLGLVSGDKSLMTDRQWEVFKTTGTVHLMVISGLHIGLSGLFGFFLGRGLAGFAVFVPCLKKTSLYIPALMSMAFAFAYYLLSGSGMAAQRALLMLLVLQVFLLFRLRFRPWWSLSVAAFVVLLFDPLVARSPGFLLSFGAVAVLLLAFSGYRQKLPLFQQWFKAQTVLAVGLLLPSLLVISGVSVSAFVANLVAIPLVSFVVVPLALLSALLMGFSESLWLPVFQCAIFVFEQLFWFLELLSRRLLGFVSYPQSLLQPAAVMLALLGGISLLLPSGARFYGLGVLCFLPLFFLQKTPPLLRITFLDAGQGTAILVETRHHQLVYDLGKRYSDKFDVGEHLMLPYLDSLAYQTVDTVMISHGDGDHAGGLPGFMRGLAKSPETLYSGQVNKTGGQQCVRGQSWHWDGVLFEVLWPSEEFLQTKQLPVANDSSCVLRISLDDDRILLAGDISQWTERRLQGDMNDTGILLAPHHGSKTSSSATWLESVNPQHVVFTAGFKNPYGHPHPSVLQRYINSGSTTHNTATDGAVRFTLEEPGQWKVERFRHDHARYWYDRQLFF